MDTAVERWQELLVDHANCEKKAASTALALLFAYPEDVPLCLALARLAREELRHFEQVARLMREAGVPFQRLAPGRYAAGLRAAVRREEPDRKLDLLLCGALIEARSAERFRRLAPRLLAPAADLYAQLETSEARHQDLYLSLARRAAQEIPLAAAQFELRLEALAQVEGDLAVAPDAQFRFHSGAPTGGAA